MRSITRHAGLALPAAVLFLAGCVPNVAWLPDSSGFIFTETVTGRKSPAMRLKQYDIQSKKSRVVLEDLGEALTCFPAVSPDGKRVAVARVLWKGNQSVAQMVIYDLAGKEQQRSKEMNWSGLSKSGDKKEWLTFVWWPSSDRLMLTAMHADIDPQTGIYDLKGDTLTTVANLYPFFLVENAPTRPDGRGFLAVENGTEVMSFVTWDGQRRELRTKEGEPILAKEAIDFRWDGVQAVLRTPAAQYSINTDSGVGLVKAVPPLAGLKNDEKVERVAVFGGGRMEFRAIEAPGMNPSMPPVRRAELREVATGKITSLAGVTQTPLVYPSPDRNYLAVRTDSKIYVVNRNGEIVADIDASFK